jgi:hypothetical protein
MDASSSLDGASRLIDDNVTTGATLSDVRGTLRDAGRGGRCLRSVPARENKAETNCL